jgi:polar amino acid transport system substrate-binding protein
MTRWLPHLAARGMVLVGLVGALVLTVSACAAPEEDGGATGPTKATAGALSKDDAAAAKLPSDITSAGKVRVASGVSFPPMEFFDSDNKTVLGFDADLGKALGQVLGVQFEFQNVNFDGIIGGLEAGRYDLGLTSMIDKKSRQAKVDFVDYLKSGVAIMVLAGNPTGIKEPLDLCGRKVAVEKGAVGDLTIDDLSKQCAAEGKPAVDRQAFPDQASAVQAVQSKRADALLALDLTLAYTVKQAGAGTFEITGEPFQTAPIGIAIPKSTPELRDAVQAALKKVIEGGVYDQLLATWGLEKQALKDASINAGTT